MFDQLPVRTHWRLAASIVLAVLGLLTAAHTALRREVGSSALYAAQREADDLLTRQVRPLLTPEDINGALSPERASDLQQGFRTRVLTNHVAEVTVRDRVGKVVFTTRPASEGSPATLTESAQAAALNGRTVASFSDAGSDFPEALATEERTPARITVTAPMRFSDNAGWAGLVTFTVIDSETPHTLASLLSVFLFAVAGVAGSAAVLLIFLRLHTRRTTHRHERTTTYARAILDTVPEVMALTDGDSRIRYLNPNGRRLLGLPEDGSLSNLFLFDRATPRGKLVLETEAMVGIEKFGAWEGAVELRGAAEREFAVSWAIRSLPFESRGRRPLVMSIRDVSDQRRLEAQLAYLASHDPLTGLFNRQRFESDVQQTAHRISLTGGQAAVLFLDLDGFKSVNDRLGHQVGDRLLERVATLLRTEVTSHDSVARLGGDEFALLLAHADPKQAQTTARRLAEVLRGDTLVIGGQRVHITASIGLAFVPMHGTTADGLLTCADQAMYQAKAHGRDGVWVYQSAGGGGGAEMDRAWEMRIRTALDRGGFKLLAQPILDLRTGDIAEYEVLLRLAGDDGEIIPPGAFMSVAERTGLVWEIDRWVVRQSIELIAAHERRGQTLRLGVNLSGKAFADRQLLPLIQQELLRTRINPSSLTLEITETAAIADLDQANLFIGQLRTWGCQFALDDFGVGFSSFSYLRNLPVNHVKIDGSFIRNMARDRADEHLVKAMVDVAKGLGKETIAEFVEGEESLRALRAIGVDYAQGYHVGRPTPVEELFGGLVNVSKSERAA